MLRAVERKRESFDFVPAAKVMVVDDDIQLNNLLVALLQSRGIAARAAYSAREACDFIAAERFDGVLLDVFLGDDNGLNAMDYLIGAQPNCKIMILTASNCVATAVNAMKRGATGFFTKDKGVDKIVDELMSLLNLRRTSELALGGNGLENHGLLGISPHIRNVVSAVDKMAAVDSTVLITGESGTGKEVVARGLHFSSPRSEGRFAAVNCGAIPENLLESELFGHRRGSFTDAKADRKGLFELCSEGTLFLDEIGDMPLSLQVKLLRVLQDREIRPVGGNDAIKVGTRVVAATHRNLEEEAKAGRFRWDLFYRLSVLQICIPPLRERREDVPVLVEHFLNLFNERFTKKVAYPRQEIMARLQAYQWPGNVRELQNSLERSVVLSQNHEMAIADLFVSHGKAGHDYAEPMGDFALDPVSYQDAKENFERRYLISLLTKSHGNISVAARLSGQYRPQLYRIISRLGIRPEDFKPRIAPLRHHPGAELLPS